MRILYFFLFIVFLYSCTEEDDYVPAVTEEIYDESASFKTVIDIVYVKSSNVMDFVRRFDEAALIKDLNGKYFNRYDIELELGTINFIENDELFDLKDNRGNEEVVFLEQTESYYDPTRIKMFIIKRSNIFGIGGMGKDNRILLTDTNLFKSTTPHEIGHVLGLHHMSEIGNVMCMMKPHLRKEFTENQIEVMKESIDAMENFD